MEDFEKFEDKDYTNSKIDIRSWKKILKILLENKKEFIALLLTPIFLAGLDILYPMLNSYAIKNYFENNNISNVSNTEIIIFICLYLLIALLYFVGVWFWILLGGRLEAKFSYTLRKQAFTKLQELSFSYYDKTPSGFIMSRMTSDSRKLSQVICWGFVNTLWAFVSMVAIVIVMISVNWKLSIIILSLIPLMLIITYCLEKTILKNFRHVRKINGNITSKINESILGSKTTKTLVLEKKNLNEFNKECLHFKKRSMIAITVSSIYWPIVLTLGYIGVGITVGYGGNLVLMNALSVDVLYLFITYTVNFFDPVMTLSASITEFQQAQASCERIVELIETKPEIKDTLEVEEKYGNILNPKYENYKKINGDIEFKNVSFSYIKNEIVLDNFNLKVNKGMTVALVGKTGSGKSTIINLLCRFYEPTKGTIFIDGHDYKEYSQGMLHYNLGYVLQSPQLFKGSITENILYGANNKTIDDVKRVCKQIGANDFIEKLKDGYDTNVGENGGKLSIGERQLISFARSIIKDPEIIVLDEATSSIDTTTELLIQDALNKYYSDKTTFIVAHRLSTITNSDLILVIDKGRIIEKGNHKELIAKRGVYYNLYKTQFISESIDKSVKES